MPGTRIKPNPAAGDPRPYDVAGSQVSARGWPWPNRHRSRRNDDALRVVDKWGNMVTYTNTIESSHGIGVFAGYKNADGRSGTSASCSTTS